MLISKIPDWIRKYIYKTGFSKHFRGRTSGRFFFRNKSISPSEYFVTFSVFLVKWGDRGHVTESKNKCMFEIYQYRCVVSLTILELRNCSTTCKCQYFENYKLNYNFIHINGVRKNFCNRYSYAGAEVLKKLNKIAVSLTLTSMRKNKDRKNVFSANR